MLRFLAAVGAAFLTFVTASGRLAVFAGLALATAFTPPFYPGVMLRQMVSIGYFSLPVVGLTAVFTGMVLALQSYTGFSRFSAEGAVATVVVLSVTRELGPVISGLMVAGRVGAAIAAEIGTMRVTDQIDALTTLSTDPLRYLVLPRLLAGVITLPMLVLVADIIGVFGGYLVGVYKLGFNPQAYLNGTWQHLETIDLVSGLVKAAVFGFIVALMGCYQGYHSRGGAQGVGRATTYAVVSASIATASAVGRAPTRVRLAYTGVRRRAASVRSAPRVAAIGACVGRLARARERGHADLAIIVERLFGAGHLISGEDQRPLAAVRAERDPPVEPLAAL